MNDNEMQLRKHIDELVRGWEEDEKWYILTQYYDKGSEPNDR